MEKELEPTNLTIRKDIKTASIKAVKDGLFTGIRDLSGLADLALSEILKTKGIIVEPEAKPCL